MKHCRDHMESRVEAAGRAGGGEYWVRCLRQRIPTSSGVSAKDPKVQS